MADTDKDLVNPDAVGDGLKNLPTGANSATLASGNDKAPEAASKTKKPGKRYRVLHTQVGEFRQHEEVSLGADVDVQRLLSLGAIEEVK